MNSFDLEPFYRHSVGFDRIRHMIESAQRQSNNSNGYPPYNIEKTSDNTYCITMAVAGFSPNNLEVVAHENTLTIKGTVEREVENTRLLHRGIAGRNFERKFMLADYVVVENAEMENGLLHIGLKRVIPESAKPRQISISSVSKSTSSVEEGVKAENKQEEDQLSS